MNHNDSNISQLKTIMERLRDPQSGCPWDIKQTFESIVQHTLEEAYEVADAVDKKDYPSLKLELGDLLLQVVFYSQIAQENDLFDFEQVVASVCNKLITRHPHVFGDTEVASVEQQQALWSQLKEVERAEKSAEEGKNPSILDDIPNAFPSLLRAHKLQKRAASVGFDWPDVGGAILKLDEEVAEVKEAIACGSDTDIAEEIGDVLFSVVNVARKSNLSAEELLRHANKKFESRFNYIENTLRSKGESWESQSLETMEEYWQDAKKSAEGVR
jgi:ATP diphosphatase